MSDAETLAAYDARCADYAALSEPDERPALARFAAALPKGGAALDLGCGPGFDAARMAAAGLVVTALDPSPAMVAAARSRGVAARLGRIEALTAEAAFDGVWAAWSLHHLPHDDWPDALARIRRALRPGGLLFLGVKAGEGEARDALGRFYAYVEAAPLRAMLAAAGLEPDAVEAGEDVGLDGRTARTLQVFARAR